jgi:hypothetical protein
MTPTGVLEKDDHPRVAHHFLLCRCYIAVVSLCLRLLSRPVHAVKKKIFAEYTPKIAVRATKKQAPGDRGTSAGRWGNRRRTARTLTSGSS